MSCSISRADDGAPTGILDGTFDNVIYKKRGQTFTIIAYRKGSQNRFGEFWQDYKKDHPFITAEIRLFVNQDGIIPARPHFRLLQGERPIFEVALVGDIELHPNGNRLSIVGTNLSADGPDATTLHGRQGAQRHLCLDFELRGYNFLEASVTSRSVRNWPTRRRGDWPSKATAADPLEPIMREADSSRSERHGPRDRRHTKSS